ncbi:hypothetical protein KXD40_008556 [Peronospora effusa]|uniref:Uncharacterized protein n=2 Tax=Peronospora TaxID=70742 RepID=A0A3M6VVY6_9STRA|nr:hypothetical protein DD238_005232 [Peronospora effusa]CAH0486802.1 unnamed protein product [Peronospora farinosa]RQM17771.1 hypothetical protein DD237_001638 [Peronospora effusa]UIZ24572.1 hypothetical protein KXD40_008556 [Peronospora effusa]CAI5729220.1 unnamed protein product [Peronospora effusa]
MEFARRLSPTNEMLPGTSYKDAQGQPLRLHVQTNTSPREPQPDSSPTTSPMQSSRSTPSSTPHDDSQRRRRSNSECLMLAKTRGGQELPGPCQEYISNVKQILARNDDQLMHLRRRRSMNLSHPTLFK